MTSGVDEPYVNLSGLAKKEPHYGDATAFGLYPRQLVNVATAADFDRFKQYDR